MFYSYKSPSPPPSQDGYGDVEGVGWWGGVGSGRQRCCKWLEGMIIERAGSGGEHGRIWYSYLALTLEYSVGSSMRDQELFLINNQVFLYS